MADRSASAQKLSSIRLAHAGAGREFFYPAGGNIEDHLAAIFKGKEYPMPDLPGFKPDLIVDIGANIGATAVYFALIFPDVPILCFEPSPSAFRIIERNTDGFDTVEIHNIGLGAGEDTVKLYDGASHCMQRSTIASAETAKGFETARIRPAAEALTALETKTHALIKIDTEGCEVAILNQLAALLDRVAVIFVEYHSEDDRHAIDALLREKFHLARARADWVHRGINHYVAKSLAGRYPQIDILKIAAR